MVSRFPAQWLAVAALSPAGYYNSDGGSACAIGAWADEVPGSARGVAPDRQTKYAAPSFTCLGVTLPFDAVNDDFCDCEDGSDEPGTSACAGQKDTLFYCKNDKSEPQYIYTSRVNDGVCDCCDGSDEWQLRGCDESRCVEEGRVLAKEKRRRETDLRSGMKQRQTLIETAKVTQIKNTEELAKLKEELPELEAQEKDTRKTMDAAKAAHEEAERRLQAVEAANDSSNVSASPLGDSTGASGDNGETPAAVAPAAESKDVPAGESTAAETEPVVSEYAKWMDGADEGGGEDRTDSPASAPADGAVVSEYTKWMDGAEEALGDASSWRRRSNRG